MVLNIFLKTKFKVSFLYISLNNKNIKQTSFNKDILEYFNEKFKYF